MKTPVARAPRAPEPEITATEPARGRFPAWQWAGLLGSALVVAALFLSVYFVHRYAWPAGSDVPQYLLRARVVASGGLDALDAAFPFPYQLNEARPGFPLLASLVHSVTGLGSVSLVFVLPAVAAAAIALGAGAFAAVALREPRWAPPVYALVVGGSVNVALTAGGHLDNLLVDALLLAAATPLLLSIEGRPAVVGAVLLLVAGVLTHWSVTLLFAAVLAVLGFLLLPESLRLRRNGVGFLRTPSGRLGAIVGGSAAIGAGALAVGPNFPPLSSLERRSLPSALARDLGAYRFAAVGPVSAVGAAALVAPRDRGRRRAHLLLLVWAGAAAVAVAWQAVWGGVPAHRILGFALAVPALVAAGIVGLARVVSRGGPAHRAAAVFLVTGGIVGFLALGLDVRLDQRQIISSKDAAAAATVGRYLDRIGGARPAVLLVDNRRFAGRAIRWSRAAAPIDQMGGIYVYLGDLDHLLAGRITLRGNRVHDRVSRLVWEGVRPVLGQHPLVLEVSAFNGGFKRDVSTHPRWEVAPGLAVIRGPRPTGITAAPLRSAPSALFLIGATVVALAALVAAGLGWSWTLLPAPWLERFALAPAFGIAALVVSGFVADRLGARLGGWQGILVFAVSAAAGWALKLITRRRRPRHAATGA